MSLFSSNPVKALDDVEQALKKVIALPHLSASQQKSAKSVVDFVMHTAQEVESATNMTKEAKAKKVKEAVARLQGLEEQFVVAASKMNATERKIGELQAQLAEKRQLLVKEEGMLKLAKLKKELLEKKLLLRKLVAEQAEAKQSSTQKQADVTLKAAELKQITAVATAVTKGDSKKETVIVGVLKMLHGRQHELEAELKKLDDAEADSDSKFAKFAANMAPGSKVLGKDEVSKAQGMLKNIKKQTHRKIQKAEAAKKVELAEVTDAVKSIEKGDVKGISKVMAKMQSEMKARTAQSGKFIY